MFLARRNVHGDQILIGNIGNWKKKKFTIIEISVPVRYDEIHRRIPNRIRIKVAGGRGEILSGNVSEFVASFLSKINFHVNGIKTEDL